MAVQKKLRWLLAEIQQREGKAKLREVGRGPSKVLWSQSDQVVIVLRSSSELVAPYSVLWVKGGVSTGEEAEC